jgi:succinoglycan biosynthesis protein ExoM
MHYGDTHITVCVCTFKRPQLLKKLLAELSRQETAGLFTFSVVISDNDRNESAKTVFHEFAASSEFPVSYCVEPEQNIALARNRAVKNADGDYIAFIDDDEYPSSTWLRDLLGACNAYGADGVLGPVFPYYETEPPKWITKGRFFERPTHPTGFRIGYGDMRTSNVLFRRKIIEGIEGPFRAEFGTGGEDADFFRRMVGNGCVFIWCNESAVYEMVPRTRYRRSYLLRRALHRGNNSFKLKERRGVRVAKALLALPVYSCSLPFLLLLGHHHFMRYLVKLCDHTGLLLAFMRIRPFEQYK